MFEGQKHFESQRHGSELALDSRSVGVSLKADHYSDILSAKHAVDFFELHAENYMVTEGVHHHYLERIADLYPLSIHGVGMSLGSADGLDPAHVKRFSDLNTRYKPALVSEHLAWSVDDGVYLNDLLPLPYTEESLKIVTDNVKAIQDAMGRQLLVENPSAYLCFDLSTMREEEFLARLAADAGCGLLLDVNNIVVSAHNMGFSAIDYADAIPADSIAEIHLAGHVVSDVDGREIRIDDHGSPVSDEVLSLYEHVIKRIGAVPTLVEWDNDYPKLAGFLNEAGRAKTVMQRALAAERGEG